MATSDKPPARGAQSARQSQEGLTQLGSAQFMTVAEVAAVMRVSKMTVYRLLHSNELPSVRVGRSFRVPAKAVDEYLHSSYFDVG